MTSSPKDSREMFGAPLPQWSLKRPKPIWQSIWDFTGAPLRMVALPDVTSERLHLTSLRAERLGVVLPLIKGSLLDIGAGDNMLVNLHRKQTIGSPDEEAAKASVGVDVVDWGADCLIVDSCRNLPVESSTFDTVSFVACLNHIPEREEAMREAVRALRPGGQVIATMIGKLIGDIGHAIWWYSEDKHRSIAEGEVMGMNPGGVMNLMRSSGLADVKRFGFVYGLNHCFVGTKPCTVGD